MLARFDIARHESASVGAEMTNYHTLTTILLRACGVNGQQMITLLQPNAGRMPNDQRQYDALVTRLRSMGHILEHAPGNIMTGLRPPNASASSGRATTMTANKPMTMLQHLITTTQLPLQHNRPTVESLEVMWVLPQVRLSPVQRIQVLYC